MKRALVMPKDREYRKTLLHEAAHAVLLYRAGQKVDCITVEAGSGSAEWTPRHCLTPEQELAIYLAGWPSEQLGDESALEDLRDFEASAMDLADAMKVLTERVGICWSERRRVEKEATKLVSAEWQKILELAEEIDKLSGWPKKLEGKALDDMLGRVLS